MSKAGAKWFMLALFSACCSQVAQAGLVAQYTFARDTIFRAKAGQDAYEGTSPGDNQPPAITNEMVNISMVTDPAVLGGRTGVIAIPPRTTFAIPNPGLLSTWTMVLHFYAPSAGLSKNYDTFFQIGSINNTTDGSLFLSNDGRIGAGSYDSVTGAFDSWHQLVVSCSNGTATIWYDGTRLSNQRSYNLTNKRFIYISLDNNEEDGTMYFDEVRLYDEARPSDVFSGDSVVVIPADTDADVAFDDDNLSATRTPDETFLSGYDKVYVFKRPIPFSFSPKADADVRMLLIGGGGAGGLIRGGGGGAGGVIQTNLALSASSTYSVEVGAGGNAQVHSQFYRNADWATDSLHPGPAPEWTSGASTTLSDGFGIALEAFGGGGGGNFNYLGNNNVLAEEVGLPGGSSGGSAGSCTSVAAAVEGQGHEGGAAYASADNVSGGGGGAGAPGVSAAANVSGAGGSGIASGITGATAHYAAGGGAGGIDVSAAGGLGGGGLGRGSANIPTPAMNGAAGTGSGGGGGSGYRNNPFWTGGGSGGSGALILRIQGDDTDPLLSLAVPVVEKSGATAVATVGGLGRDATSATLSLEISASSDFAGATAVYAGRTITAAGDVPEEITGLEPETDYFLRATIVTDQSRTATATAAFRTSARLHPMLDTSTFLKCATFTASGYSGAGSLQKFPVLVRLSENSPQGFHHYDCAVGGADIRFADADGELMPCEIDTWNPDGESTIWALLPTISGSNTTFTMYFKSGDPSALASAMPERVWDDYVAVVHGGAAPFNSADTTVTASLAGSCADLPGGGVVGAGNKNSTGSDRISITNPTSALTDGSRFTLSGWVRKDANGNSTGTAILMGSMNSWNNTGFLVLQELGNELSFTSGSSGHNKAVSDLATGTWRYITIVYDNTKGSSYRDAAPVLTDVTIPAVGNSGIAWSFGNYGGTGNASDSLRGGMDEWRVYDGVESAERIKANFDTMRVGSGFLSAGAVEDTTLTAASFPEAPIVTKSADDEFVLSGYITGSPSTTYTLWAVYRGSDGQAITNQIAAAASVDDDGVLAFSDTPANLADNTLYTWSALASDAGGTKSYRAGVGVFYTGAISASRVADANEFSLVHGAFNISRSGTAAATNGALTVDYTVSGTAIPGQTYRALSGTVTFAPGATNVVVDLEPLVDRETTVDTTVTVSIATNGLYHAGSSATAQVINDGNVMMSAIRCVPLGASDEKISIDSTAVAAGTIYKVELSVDGRPVRTWSGQSAASTFEYVCVGVKSSAHTAVFTVTSYINGHQFVKSYAQSFTIGSTSQTIASFSDAVSAKTAVRLQVGDIVNFPRGDAGGSYRILQPRVLEGNGADGFVDLFSATATEAGVCGVEYIGSDDSVVATFAVLVLPERIGNGSIYIYDETSSTKEYWTRATTWEKVGAESNNSWPRSANDIAIMPFYDHVGGRFIRLESDVTVGSIYLGQFRNQRLDDICVERHSSSGFRTLTFRRTDGKPALLQLSPNGQSSNASLKFRMGGFPIAVSYESDTIFDGGWAGVGSSVNAGRWEFRDCTNNIHEGVTLEFRNVYSEGHTMGYTFTAGNLAGSGTVWNRSAASVRYSGDHSAFSGTIRDSGRGATHFDRSCAAYFLYCENMTNVACEVEGFVHVDSGNPSVGPNCAGVISTGWNHFYGGPRNTTEETRWFPERSLTMRGGSWLCSPNHGKDDGDMGTYGIGKKDIKHTGALVVDSGFSYLRMDTQANGDYYPINTFRADALAHSGKGTIGFSGNCVFNPAATSTNNLTFIGGAGPLLEGAGGNPLTTDAYSILPWATMSVNSMQFFATVDGEDRLVLPAYSNTTLDGASGPTANAYSDGKDLTISSPAGVTLNSLVLGNNSGRNRTLGAGKTLTLTSGALSMYSDDTAIGTKAGGEANGSLVLGSADRPGYVFAQSRNKDKPNAIWAPVTAPGGLVVGYTGYFLLGGDQAGIDGEIVVNSGTTYLGALDGSKGAAIDVPLRIVGGGATVRDMSPGTFKVGSWLVFDRVAGYTGKFAPPEGGVERVWRVYVNDVDEGSTTTLARGTWGSSESQAENVDDGLFVGTGVLKVQSDTITRPMVIMLR